MSNSIFQTMINQMKDVVGRTIGVIDENGIIVSCSDLSKIGKSKQRIKKRRMKYGNYFERCKDRHGR